MADRRGFTLVEILVCIALVSILSAISYPAFGSWVKRTGMRSEVSTLVGCLHSAKMEAVKTNSYVVIEADPTGYSVFVDNSPVPDEAGDWIKQAGERQLFSCRLRNGLTLASNFTNNKARFSSRPGITAGRFILTDIDGSRSEVVLNVVGRIRVE
jgi:prepilin-type N-terminal cleavage/methylation domain-containing protein